MRFASDRAPLRIGSFVAVLAVLFAAAFGLGRLLDDGAVVERDSADQTDHRLDLTSSQPAAGGPVAIGFSVRDADDAVVTRFAVRHEKRMHLIAVRKDFAEFRHVHPRMTADGNWTVDADLTAGPWRLYADFQQEGGEAEVLSRDIAVDGRYQPETDQAVRRTTTVDGYTVAVAGDLSAGAGAALTFTVSKDGVPVAGLQPYLGAYGHLVVLRSDDMRYLHVHSEDRPAGPEVDFGTEVPSAGEYHLYLDFRHGGVVRTASFVLDTPGSTTDGATEHGGDHDDQ